MPTIFGSPAWFAEQKKIQEIASLPDQEQLAAILANLQQKEDDQAARYETLAKNVHLNEPEMDRLAKDMAETRAQIERGERLLQKYEQAAEQPRVEEHAAKQEMIAAEIDKIFKNPSSVRDGFAKLEQLGKLAQENDATLEG